MMKLRRMAGLEAIATVDRRILRGESINLMVGWVEIHCVVEIVSTILHFVREIRVRVR